MTIAIALALVPAAACQGVPPVPVPLDRPARGFASSPLPFPGLGGFVPPASATLSNGDVLTWDGSTVTRYDAAGNPLATLATFTPPVFQSVLAVAPDESYCIVGESSFGELRRVDLVSGGSAFVAFVFQSYDAVFDGPDSLLVSALPGGFTNEVGRVDVLAGTVTPVAQVPGPSGPLVLSPGGDLYLGTVANGFPAPPGSSTILRFDAADLALGTLLTELDASLVASGLDGVTDLALDPATGELYVADNNYGLASNRLLRVDPASGAVEPLFTGAVVPGGPRTISNLEFLPGPGPQAFLAYQPEGGGRLRFQTTDFFSAFEREDLQPDRPSLAYDGALGRLTLDGGPSLGLALVLGCPAASFGAELPLALPGATAPLFVGLRPPLASAGVALLSGKGAGALSVPPGLAFAFQALVLDAHLDLVATSAPALP